MENYVLKFANNLFFSILCSCHLDNNSAGCLFSAHPLWLYWSLLLYKQENAEKVTNL